MSDPCKQISIFKNKFIWFAGPQQPSEAMTPLEKKGPASAEELQYLQDQVKATKEMVKNNLIKIFNSVGVKVDKNAILVNVRDNFIRQRGQIEKSLGEATTNQIEEVFTALDQLDSVLKDRQAAEDELVANLNKYGSQISNTFSQLEERYKSEKKEKTKEWEQNKNRYDPMNAELYNEPETVQLSSVPTKFTERETPAQEETGAENMELNKLIREGSTNEITQEVFKRILNGPRVNNIDVSMLGLPNQLVEKFHSYISSLEKGVKLNLSDIDVYVTPSIEGDAVRFDWSGELGPAKVEEYVVINLSDEAPRNPEFKEKASDIEKIQQEKNQEKYLTSVKELTAPNTPAGSRLYVKQKENRFMDGEMREVTVSRMYVKRHMIAGRPDQYRMYIKIYRDDGKPYEGYENFTAERSVNLSDAQLNSHSEGITFDSKISGPRPSVSEERMAKYMRRSFSKAIQELKSATIVLTLSGPGKPFKSETADEHYSKALKGIEDTIAVYGVEDPYVRKQLKAANIEVPETGSTGRMALKVAPEGVEPRTLNVDIPSKKV